MSLGTLCAHRKGVAHVSSGSMCSCGCRWCFQVGWCFLLCAFKKVRLFWSPKLVLWWCGFAPRPLCGASKWCPCSCRVGTFLWFGPVSRARSFVEKPARHAGVQNFWLTQSLSLVRSLFVRAHGATRHRTMFLLRFLPQFACALKHVVGSVMQCNLP